MRPTYLTVAINTSTDKEYVLLTAKDKKEYDSKMRDFSLPRPIDAEDWIYRTYYIDEATNRIHSFPIIVTYDVEWDYKSCNHYDEEGYDELDED